MIIPFEELHESDLYIDAVYEGGNKKNISDDPISKLMKCENMGGFRKLGSVNPFSMRYVTIYSSLRDLDWVDHFDLENGRFIYFGDNKSPGTPINQTKKKGNEILEKTYHALHLEDRSSTPPFFVFTKGEKGRDVVFRGLAVPGVEGMSSNEDLIALWKTKEGFRYQNYKATFTILDVPVIRRGWLDDLYEGKTMTCNTPSVYKKWVETGIYTPLRSSGSIKYRKKGEQLPSDKAGMEIVKIIYDHFSEDAFEFEGFAAELVKLMDSNIIRCDLTRPWVDGGRDAMGDYRIGEENNSIKVEFALEAKRYDVTSGVGVRHTSRLISRIRHRQFGILVTSSYVSEQAYKEIAEDGHPIIVISSGDIVDILRKSGFNSVEMVSRWLVSKFGRD